VRTSPLLGLVAILLASAILATSIPGVPLPHTPGAGDVVNAHAPVNVSVKVLKAVLGRLVRHYRHLSRAGFLNAFLAGRPLLIKSSQLRPLLGVRARSIYVFAWVPPGEWVSVPVVVFNKVFRVGAETYYVVPKVVDPGTRLIVKAPPTPITGKPSTAKHAPIPSRILKRVGGLKAAYDMVVRACVGGDCALIHYLVVVGSVPNPWVIKDSHMREGVEDGFKAWGINGFLSVVKRGVEEGVVPENISAALIEYYSTSPINASAVIRPVKLVVGGAATAAQPGTGSEYVLELIPPYRTWGARGDLGRGELSFTAVLQLRPASHALGSPVTQSVTFRLVIRRHSPEGEAHVTVKYVCGKQVIIKHYTIYEAYADLRPTYYWPPSNTVKLEVSAEGEGVWSMSIIGATTVQLVNALALKTSKLTKELDLYPLGGVSDGFKSYVALPRGVNEAVGSAPLTIPMQVALINGEFVGWRPSTALRFRVMNSGNADAYVTVCVAGACSGSALVRAGGEGLVTIKGVWTSDIESYYWYQEFLPVLVSIRKSGEGVSLIALRPEAPLRLLARPVVPRYPQGGEPYLVTSLYKDSYVPAWSSGFQEFRGGFIASYLGVRGSLRGTANLYVWASTSVENSQLGCEPVVEAMVAFFGAREINEVPYGVVKVVIDVTGKYVASGDPLVRQFIGGPHHPRLKEVPPPLSAGAALLGFAGIPYVDIAATIYGVIAWLWNTLCGFMESKAGVTPLSNGYEYVWMCGALGSPRDLLMFQGVDLSPFIPSTTNALRVKVTVYGAEERAPYFPLEDSLNTTIKLARLGG